MKDIQDSLIVMKVLCNKHRYAIMQLLLTTTKDDLCVNQIADAVGISQSLASHNLSFLQAHGVVVGKRMGQTICYEASDSPLTKKIKRVMNALA